MNSTPPIPDTSDPIGFFRQWYDEAIAQETDVPNAMSLATVGKNGRPSSRMVLLKDVGERGFVFYTNTTSRKSIELAHNNNAALCFHWKSLKRQVRVEGTVSFVSDADADAYFASRPRQSQVAAWASRQSEKLHSRETLINRFNELDERFKGADVPRLDAWKGYCLKPDFIEFWQDVRDRLHDRLVFRRENGAWISERQYP